MSLLGDCSLCVVSSGKDDHLVRWVCKRSAMHFRVFVKCCLEMGQIGRQFLKGVKLRECESQGAGIWREVEYSNCMSFLANNRAENGFLHEHSLS